LDDLQLLTAAAVALLAGWCARHAPAPVLLLLTEEVKATCGLPLALAAAAATTKARCTVHKRRHDTATAPLRPAAATRHYLKNRLTQTTF
jgi:hypothetical protein